MEALSARLRLRVAPGSAHSSVVGRYGEAWKIRVAAPPEDGRANDAVLRFLADTLSVPRASLTLVSGHGARDKIVELTGIGPVEVEQRLSALAGKGSLT